MSVLTAFLMVFTLWLFFRDYWRVTNRELWHIANNIKELKNFLRATEEGRTNYQDEQLWRIADNIEELVKFLRAVEKRGIEGRAEQKNDSE